MCQYEFLECELYVRSLIQRTHVLSAKRIEEIELIK
jgi:hypothetical protein